jgi:peroxiredoxin
VRTLFLLLAICACAVPVAAQTVQVTLKPEENLAQLASVRRMSIALGDKPPRTLVKEPVYRSGHPRYGSLRLENAPNNLIALVIDEATIPRIYVDVNGDGDLTNDGSYAWDREVPFYLRSVKFDVKYSADAKETYPYTLIFMRNPARYPDHVFYFTDSFRWGEVKFGEVTRKIAVVDDNANGRFDDLQNAVLLIDTDGDGKLNGRADSHEWFSATEPFNVGGKTYEVAAIDAAGVHVTLRVSSKQVPPKPLLTRNSPALDFTAKDVNGKTVSLSQFKGKTVLLVFWSLYDDESWRQFPNLKRVHQTFQDKGLVVIGISWDKDPKVMKEFMKDRYVDWIQILDGADDKFALTKLYRVRNLPSHFLIDGKGNIIGLGLRGQELYDAIEAAVTASK